MDERIMDVIKKKVDEATPEELDEALEIIEHARKNPVMANKPKRHRNDILRDIRYELSPEEHTFHMCGCGRKGCRSNKCLICLREEFNS